MFENKKISAIIPARGTNDMLDNLNLRTLAGQPMINYTINAAKKSKYIDEIFVSTEDDRIKELASAHHVVPFMRPMELTSTGVSSEEVAFNVISHINKSYDMTVILWPNAPFRGEDIIDGAIEFFIKNDYRKVQGVKIISDYFLKKENEKLVPMKLSRGKDRPDVFDVFAVAGGIFIFDTILLNNNDELVETGSYIIHEHKARLIYSLYDLLIAERLIKLHHTLVDSLAKST